MVSYKKGSMELGLYKQVYILSIIKIARLIVFNELAVKCNGIYYIIYTRHSALIL